MSSIFEKEKELFLSTYNRVPVDLSHGEGVHLFDKSGNRYLDFFSGLGVNALGYAHPKIIKAVSKQISEFGHLSNSFIPDVQIEFAELMLKYSGMSKIFLSNSGTESIEGAIKAVRKLYGPDKKIFSLTNAFHGRTYGSMTLGKEKYKKDFAPLVPNIFQISFNDAEDLSNKIDENTAAVFIEFIQGEGGINLISAEFADKLSELRNKFDFAIAADEIQSGAGRTGKPFAYNYFNLKPDILCCAKAIGGGLPLGAFLTSEKFIDVFEAGMHGTTFGGNPVSCAAGIIVLKEVFENGLMQHVFDEGNYFIEQLNELKKSFPDHIKDVRGRGFMIGVELFYECSDMVKRLRGRKILSNCTNQNTIRILPPLIAERKEIDFFLYNFHEILKQKVNES